MKTSKKWEKKVPLRHYWTFWYQEKNENKPWVERLKKVRTFSTEEDFWSFYKNVKPVSSIKNGCDYSLFKAGIKPMWEDDANVTGGRWIVEFNRDLPANKLDRHWLDLTLAMIGHNIPETDNLICGATVNLRATGHRIALWLRDTNNVNGGVMRIGLTFRELLELGRGQVIKFQTHFDVQHRNRLGKIKTTYFLYKR